MRLVIVSDTHPQDDDVLDGDVLIHCGDGTFHGSLDEVRLRNEWFEKQPHRYKISIAGNHDWGFQQMAKEAHGLFSGSLYLQDAIGTSEGVNFYGSPWTPRFHDWVFNFRKGRFGTEAAEKTWKKIPTGIDVLITHRPPYGILDWNMAGKRCGDRELLTAADRVKPKVHAFGHIHGAHGTYEFANAFGGLTVDLDSTLLIGVRSDENVKPSVKHRYLTKAEIA